jgi:hypothetical protein
MVYLWQKKGGLAKTTAQRFSSSNGNHQFWQEKEGQFGETNFLLIIHPHKSIFQLSFVATTM